MSKFADVKMKKNLDAKKTFRNPKPNFNVAEC